MTPPKHAYRRAKEFYDQVQQLTQSAIPSSTISEYDALPDLIVPPQLNNHDHNIPGNLLAALSSLQSSSPPGINVLQHLLLQQQHHQQQQHQQQQQQKFLEFLKFTQSLRPAPQSAGLQTPVDLRQFLPMNHNNQNTNNFIDPHKHLIFQQLSKILTSLPHRTQNSASNVPGLFPFIKPQHTTSTAIPHNTTTNSNHNSSSPDTVNSIEESSSTLDNTSSCDSVPSNKLTRQIKRKNPTSLSQATNPPTVTPSKVVRPFKLYKSNDKQNDQSVFEALGITKDDEDWLLKVIENKNVADLYQFLLDVMEDKVDTNIHDFSSEMLQRIRSKFGYVFGTCNSTISNPKMIRHPDMTPQELKTDEYWEKRRKNNEAAKKSREARRQKEETLTKRCEELILENDNIRKEIDRVKMKIHDIRSSISV